MKKSFSTASVNIGHEESLGLTIFGLMLLDLCTLQDFKPSWKMASLKWNDFPLCLLLQWVEECRPLSCDLQEQKWHKHNAIEALRQTFTKIFTHTRAHTHTPSCIVLLPNPDKTVCRCWWSIFFVFITIPLHPSAKNNHVWGDNLHDDPGCFMTEIWHWHKILDKD